MQIVRVFPSDIIFAIAKLSQLLMKREIALKFNIDPPPSLFLTTTCIGVGLDETLLCPSWETGERQQHRRHGRTALPVCLPPPSTNAGLARQGEARDVWSGEEKMEDGTGARRASLRVFRTKPQKKREKQMRCRPRPHP